jgi:hypothetical protein
MTAPNAGARGALESLSEDISTLKIPTRMKEVHKILGYDARINQPRGFQFNDPNSPTDPLICDHGQ